MSRKFGFGLNLGLFSMILKMLDSWNVATDEQIKVVLEPSSLSDYESENLEAIINKVGAFSATRVAESFGGIEDDVPF